MNNSPDAEKSFSKTVFWGKQPVSGQLPGALMLKLIMQCVPRNSLYTASNNKSINRHQCICTVINEIDYNAYKAHIFNESYDPSFRSIQINMSVESQ
jgi:hypothetical protein